MNVAITGASGRLGTALQPYFPRADFLSHASLDVGNGKRCRDWFSHRQYDLILHCGAVTAHDADPGSLLQTNVIGTANVVHWAKKMNARLVYTSTDAVYDGSGHHTEGQALKPNNHYAWSKLGGEIAVQSYASHLIIRGSWYDHLQYARAATDAYTSKIPVAQAAGFIARLSQSTYTGTVNIGGPRRSIYEIVVTEMNPGVFGVRRDQVQGLDFQIPKDLSLDLTKMRRLLG